MSKVYLAKVSKIELSLVPYPKRKKKRKKNRNVSRKITLYLFLGIFLISLVSAEQFVIYVKPLDANNNPQPLTSFIYNFTLTTSLDCSGAVFSNQSVIITGKDGIGYVNLTLPSLSSVPQYLCEYRDGSLRKVHELSSQTFDRVYTKNLNVSRNIDADGNLTLGEKITFKLGQIIDAITNGWIKITGNLRVLGEINSSGTIYINNVTNIADYMYNFSLSVPDNSLKLNISNITNFVYNYNQTFASEYHYNLSTATYNMYGLWWYNQSSPYERWFYNMSLYSPENSTKLSIKNITDYFIEISYINNTQNIQSLINGTSIWFSNLNVTGISYLGTMDLQGGNITADYFKGSGAELYGVNETDPLALKSYTSIALTNQSNTFTQAQIILDYLNVSSHINTEETYKIGNLTVLTTGGDIRAISVGVYSGRSNIGRNVNLGYIAGDEGDSNYSINVGFATGRYNTGDDAIGIGRNANYQNTKDYVIGIGRDANYENTGDHVISIGWASGRYGTGNYNLHIGTYTGTGYPYSGNSNTFIGYQAGMDTTTGHSNFFFGRNAGLRLTSGVENLGIGAYSLALNNGNYNTYLGSQSGYYGKTSDSSVVIGYKGDYFNQAGLNNTEIGFKAGAGTTYHNKSGVVYIGYEAGYSETKNQTLYIENSRSTSPLIYGEFDSDVVVINGNLTIDFEKANTIGGYPLTVIGNVSGISAWFDGDISVNNTRTRTKVWDKAKYGGALSWIKDSSELVSIDGKVKHNLLSPNVVESRVLRKVGEKEEKYEDKVFIGFVEKFEYKNVSYTDEDGIKRVDEYKISVPQPVYETQIKTRKVPVYEWFEYEEVYVEDILAKHEQAIYELKQENEMIKSELCKYDKKYIWCK